MKRTNVDTVVDATRSALMEIGVKRTTFAEVARRANMSRATLYTHFPDVESAIASVLTRELGGLLSVSQSLVGNTAHERLMGTLRGGVRRLQGHPVLTRVMADDPDLLLPYVVTRFGEVQQVALEKLVGVVIDGQTDGSIRPGRPTTIATSVLLAVQSAILGQQIDQVDSDAVNMLLDMVDRGLRP